MPSRRLVSGDHGADEVFSLQYRHDDHSKDVERDHGQEYPSDDLMQLLCRLASERPWPNSPGNECQ